MKNQKQLHYNLGQMYNTTDGTCFHINKDCINLFVDYRSYGFEEYNYSLIFKSIDQIEKIFNKNIININASDVVDFAEPFKTTKWHYDYTPEEEDPESEIDRASFDFIKYGA